MKVLTISVLALLALVVSSSFAPGPSAQDATPSIDLAGEWRFALDPEDVGIEERWWERELPDRIRLPGILQAHTQHGPPVAYCAILVLCGYQNSEPHGTPIVTSSTTGNRSPRATGG